MRLVMLLALLAAFTVIGAGLFIVLARTADRGSSPLMSLFLLAVGLCVILLVIFHGASGKKGAKGSNPSPELFALAELEGRPACVTDRKGRIKALGKSFPTPSRCGKSPTHKGMNDQNIKELSDFLQVVMPKELVPLPGTIRRILIAGRRLQLPLGEDGSARLNVLPISDGQLFWTVDGIGTPCQTGAERKSRSDAIPRIVMNRSGIIIDANSSARQFLGAVPAELAALVGDLPLRPHGVHLVKTASGPRQARIITRQEDGGLQALYLFPVGEEEALALDVEDVLERTPVPFLKLSPGGLIAYANPPARELLGLAARPAMPFSHVFEGPGRPIHEWLSEALKSRRSLAPQTVHYENGGREGHAQITFSKGMENGQVFLLAHVQDASALMELEAQLSQSRKMHLVGQLAGGIAHDFNNILAIISGQAELLEEELSPIDKGMCERVREILSVADRGRDLVRGILGFSRRQPLILQDIDLGNLVAGVTRMLHPLLGSGIRIESTLPSSPLHVRADPGQLEQILVNLAVNARDAMDGCGVISIEAQLEHYSRPRTAPGGLLTIPVGAWIRLEMRDTGPGLPKDPSRIFEPFFTTKPKGKGTGLGLAMCYGLMKQMGGFIFAVNHPEGGAAFTLYLPEALEEKADFSPMKQASFELCTSEAVIVTQRGCEADLSPRKGNGDPGRKARPTRRILVVEDEPGLRRFISHVLGAEGYLVETAETGEKARKLIQSKTRSGCSFDLIISDITLPGDDGPGWVRKLRGDLIASVSRKGVSNENSTDMATWERGMRGERPQFSKEDVNKHHNPVAISTSLVPPGEVQDPVPLPSEGSNIPLAPAVHNAHPPHLPPVIFISGHADAARLHEMGEVVRHRFLQKPFRKEELLRLVVKSFMQA